MMAVRELPPDAASDLDANDADATESQRAIRVMRPRRAAPADAVRPTRAEVNLHALRHNVAVVRERAQGAKVWAVLKADGYGHGAPAVARTLERAKVDGFCVALLEEAIELRDAGIAAPILVMGGYYGRAYDEVLRRNLTPVLYDPSHLEGFARLVRSGTFPGPVSVHVKIDTGMARLGVRPKDLAAFADALAETPEVRVEGLMTHLANADAETAVDNDAQVARFDEATAYLAKRGVRAKLRHAANSAALLKQSALLDAVRPGIAVFGICPSIHDRADLQMAMRVRTEVVDVRTIDPGDPVGYGGLYRASRKARIATVSMGYADGLPRALSNRGAMLVRGKRAPIVGAVSMDMTMLDVTEIPEVGLRDEVVVLGGQEGTSGKDFIGAEEMARNADQIPWEVLTQISRRVPRFYREP